MATSTWRARGRRPWLWDRAAATFRAPTTSVLPQGLAVPGGPEDGEGVPELEADGRLWLGGLLVPEPRYPPEPPPGPPPGRVGGSHARSLEDQEGHLRMG